MAVEGGMKCLKFLQFFFNFIFWICGLALIIVGILVQKAIHSTFVIRHASASWAPLVLIIVGLVIFFIAFFGCCGAWKENYCMITMFSILLSLIVTVEIGAAIAGYVFRGRLTVIVQDSLTDMLKQYNNGTDEFKRAVDELQEGFKCCGVKSSSDWEEFKTDGISVPDSCCLDVTTGCGLRAMTDASKVYQEGCQDAVEELLKDNVQWIIVAALLIALLQIMAIVFACCLRRGIRVAMKSCDPALT